MTHQTTKAPGPRLRIACPRTDVLLAYLFLLDRQRRLLRGLFVLTGQVGRCKSVDQKVRTFDGAVRTGIFITSTHRGLDKASTWQWQLDDSTEHCWVRLDTFVVVSTAVDRRSIQAERKDNGKNLPQSGLGIRASIVLSGLSSSCAMIEGHNVPNSDG